MAQQLAKEAWFVKVRSADDNPFIVDFAISRGSAQEAISVALSHMEASSGSEVTFASQLTPVEIKSYRLRPNEVRAYGRRVYDRSAGRWVWDIGNKRI